MKRFGRCAVSAILCLWATWARAADAPNFTVEKPLLFSNAEAPPPVSPADGQPAGVEWGGPEKKTEEDPPPLYLSDFFSTGWDEDFTRRDSEGRAPDLALLRVQTNFMEREIRSDYFHVNNVASRRRENINNVDYLIAYGLNRRFQVTVAGDDEWVDGRKGPDLSGATARLAGRLQLVSTPDSSYSFNFQVAPRTSASASIRRRSATAWPGSRT